MININKEVLDLQRHLASCIPLTQKSSDFLISSLSQVNPFNDTGSVIKWIEEKKNQRFEVTKISLSKIEGWYFEETTGNLRHQSGKFFSIEGIRVETNAGPIKQWSQPIINQPEIGVLGILTKKFNGILYFLMQAKMEPGNINKVQLSPTVQATKSNYSRVHKGKVTKYLEYFLDKNKSWVLLDQLQSEQGGRFLRKRNRNIIIEVPSNEDVPVYEDFCWLTLGQIKKLLEYDNLVNMDTRTVISCIYYNCNGNDSYDIDRLKECIHYSPIIEDRQSGYYLDILKSAMKKDEGLHGLDDIRSWSTNLKTKYYMDVNTIPLRDVEKWKQDEFNIFHEDGTFFKVIGASIDTDKREVGNWCQPLVEQIESGVVGFITKKRNGILHFLVQAKVEPGNFDILEMAPTVQCITGSYKNEKLENQPKYLNMFLNPDPTIIRYHARQSEEGGRFYQEQNDYWIVEVGDEFPIEQPENFIWMTLGQITEFVKHNNYVNVEARSLISCIGMI